jgi:hypothetical protein
MLASTDAASRRRALPQTFFLIAAALCAWTLQTSTARAETTIGADLDMHVPLSINNVTTGAGFGIRLGTELHLPLIAVNPEFGFTYAEFSKDTPPTVYRAIAGGRIGIGELVRFGVLAHVGFGYVNWKPAPDNYSHSGLTYDAGIFLEFTALPLLNIGVHATYNRMASADDQPQTLHWLSIGLHATIVF